MISFLFLNRIVREIDVFMEIRKKIDFARFFLQYCALIELGIIITQSIDLDIAVQWSTIAYTTLGHHVYVCSLKDQYQGHEIPAVANYSILSLCPSRYFSKTTFFSSRYIFLSLSHSFSIFSSTIRDSFTHNFILRVLFLSIVANRLIINTKIRKISNSVYTHSRLKNSTVYLLIYTISSSPINSKHNSLLIFNDNFLFQLFKLRNLIPQIINRSIILLHLRLLFLTQFCSVDSIKLRANCIGPLMPTAVESNRSAKLWKGFFHATE